jgi:hypothetical protein
MSGGDWQKVHSELSRLARSRATLDAEEATWLVEAVRVRVHEPLGFGSLLEYLERALGYGPRLAKERLRVAEALSGLSALRASLARAELPWSAVRELSRVATQATETEWIAAARGKTVRQIEEMVSGRRIGDRPGDPADPRLRRHVLRLEISADSLAAFREARRHLELELDHSLEDDETVRLLAHCALDGARDPGRAPYQVAMTVCTECRRGTRDGAGQVFDVESHHVDAALCDAQQIFIDPQPIAPAVPDLSFERTAEDVQPSPAPLGAAMSDTREPSPAPLGAAMSDTREPPAAMGAATDDGVRPRPGEGADGASLSTHVGPCGPGMSPTCCPTNQPAPRPTLSPLVPAATQTIPPRIRRLIWRRDHRRCKVPGCRSASFLEIHHLVPLSEGGDHDPSRMLLICSGHHTRVHTGRLRIDGIAPDRLAFSHANGAPYGQIHGAKDSAIDRESTEREAGHDMETDAVGALRRTGVSPGDARRAVAEAARSLSKLPARSRVSSISDRERSWEASRQPSSIRTSRPARCAWDLFLDGDRIGGDDVAPFAVDRDTTELAEGKAELWARVVIADGGRRRRDPHRHRQHAACRGGAAGQPVARVDVAIHGTDAPQRARTPLPSGRSAWMSWLAFVTLADVFAKSAAAIASSTPVLKRCLFAPRSHPGRVILPGKATFRGDCIRGSRAQFSYLARNWRESR